MFSLEQKKDHKSITNSYLKKLGKEEQSKPKPIRTKDIIKIKVKINEEKKYRKAMIQKASKHKSPVIPMWMAKIKSSNNTKDCQNADKLEHSSIAGEASSKTKYSITIQPSNCTLSWAFITEKIMLK